KNRVSGIALRTERGSALRGARARSLAGGLGVLRRFAVAAYEWGGVLRVRPRSPTLRSARSRGRLRSPWPDRRPLSPLAPGSVEIPGTASAGDRWRGACTRSATSRTLALRSGSERWGNFHLATTKRWPS